jgi:hypothetical protein
MKTALFYIFYSAKKKNYYSIKDYLKCIEKIHKIVKRRLELSNRKIIDLDFEIQKYEEHFIYISNKLGNLEGLGGIYIPMILKIVNSINPISYYQAEESEHSKYHLNLIEINSFLTHRRPQLEEKLKNLREEITITWLFG